MQAYQREFIDFAIKQQALCFGQYTLKSGRVSPYFFNAGLFNSAESLAAIGRAFAACIMQQGWQFDLLFGPAYKGIPLATTTCVALAEHHHCNPLYAFNRKLVKDHGEGGNLVGAPLRGKVVIIDDVITAGTAFRESYQLITAAGAEVAGVVVALDRQERGLGTTSALQEIQNEYKIPVASIIKLDDLMQYIGQVPALQETLGLMKQYRAEYGSQVAEPS
jgi:orotate phosphoribosyltransferase